MKPGAGQGSPFRVAPLYRAIQVNSYIRLGLVTYTTIAASWRPPSCWAVDAEPGTLVARAKVGCGSVKKGQVGGAVAGSRRLWWGGAVLAAFCCALCSSSTLWSMSLLCRSCFGVLPVIAQDREYGPDSAARGVPQLHFLDKVLTCPLLRRLVHEGAVLGQGCDMPVVATTGAWRCSS